MPTRRRTFSLLLIAALFTVLTVALPVAAARQSAAPAEQACAEAVINGGFEADGGWSFGQTALVPRLVASPAHSGARSLQLGNQGGANINSFSSARQTITIPATATNAILSFWYFPVIEANAGADFFEFALMNPDGSTVWGGPWRMQTGFAGWNEARYDLSAWRGQTFQLYFNAFNDGYGGRTAIFLDDVSLSTCGGIPGAPTLTPTPSGTPGCMELIRNGAFNEALAYWETVDAPGAAIAVERFVSAPYALKLGSLDQSLNGFQTARQQVSLPAGYSNITLDVSIFTQSQPGAGADFQEIRLLSANGVSLFAPYPPSQSNDNAWRRYQFDVSAFAGQTVFLRFGVNNDGAGGRTAMYVDDVRITACGSAPLPTPWPTAAPTVWPTPWPTPWPTAAPTSWPTAWPTVLPPPPPSGCVDVLQNGRFDAGLNGWQVGRNALPASAVAAPALSPPYAAMMGTTTRNLNSFSSIRQTVTVPPGYARTIIGFWEYTWADSLAGGDLQEFVILGPGNLVWATPWKVLESQQGWQQHLYELINAPSATFDVYFAAINDGYDGRAALYVDEVRVWACSAGSLPPMDAISAGALAAPPPEPGLSAQMVELTPQPGVFAAPEFQPQMALPQAVPQQLVAPPVELTPQPVVTPQVVPFAPPIDSRAVFTPVAQGAPLDLSGSPSPEWTEVTLAGQATPTPSATLPPPESGAGTPALQGRAVATEALSPSAILTAAAAAAENVAPSTNRLPFGLFNRLAERAARWPIRWPWVLLLVVVALALLIIGLIQFARRRSNGSYER